MDKLCESYEDYYFTTHISYTSKKTNIQYAEILYPAVEKAPYLFRLKIINRLPFTQNEQKHALQTCLQTIFCLPPHKPHWHHAICVGDAIFYETILL